MLSLPNLFSLMRFPLAFCFLQGNTVVRFIAITLALMSDGLDGYLARRYNACSRLGTILDPLMDKFFVFVVLFALMNEDRITLLQVGALICRDFSVVLFGVYLALTGKLANYQFRAIWCGKISTCLQFIVLLGLTLNVVFPSSIFILFIILGVLALGELYFVRRFEEQPGKNFNL